MMRNSFLIRLDIFKKVTIILRLLHKHKMDEWRKIEGYPNYEINRDGIVLNIETGRILKVSKNGKRYLQVSLCHNGVALTKLIHRLVGAAFIQNPEGKSSIDHIDGNKMNNSLENLRWATIREQSQNKPSKGYYKIKGSIKNPWRAETTKSDGKRIGIGIFPTEELAQIAVRNARIKYHGEFANLNRADAEVPHPAD